MSIQQAISNDYYRLADIARTPEQINALKQHIAKSVMNGNLMAYEGVPLISSLDAKLQQHQKDAAIKAGLLPQPQPIADQVLQSALAPQQAMPQQAAPMQQPQQTAQAPVPQGIDTAQSNLPTEMAGGGIVAFDEGGSAKSGDGYGTTDLAKLINLDVNALPNMANVPGGVNMNMPPSLMERGNINIPMDDGTARLGATGITSLVDQGGNVHKNIAFRPGMLEAGYSTKAGPGYLDVSGRRSIEPIPGKGHAYGVNAQYTIPLAEGGAVGYNGEDNDQVVYDDGASQLQQNYQPVAYDPSKGGPEYISELPSYLQYKVGPLLRGIREQVNTGKVTPGATWDPSKQAPSEPAPTETKPVEAKPETKKDTGIVIHDTAPKAKPGVDTLTNTKLETPTGGDLSEEAKKQAASREELKKLILGEKDDEKKQLGIQALLAAMAGGFKMAAGTSPYAATNIGAGGEAFAQQLGQGIAGVRADKQRQIQQLVALGLKGQELDAELAKLGITKELYNSEVYKNMQYGKYLGAKGSGIGGITAGPIGAKDYIALKREYQTLAVNPKSDPTFFASLPKDVREALSASPGTPSYQRGMDAVKNIVKERMQQDVNEARIVGARKVPMSSLETE